MLQVGYEDEDEEDELPILTANASRFSFFFAKFITNFVEGHHAFDVNAPKQFNRIQICCPFIFN